MVSRGDACSLASVDCFIFRYVKVNDTWSVTWRHAVFIRGAYPLHLSNRSGLSNSTRSQCCKPWWIVLAPAPTPAPALTCICTWRKPESVSEAHNRLHMPIGHHITQAPSSVVFFLHRAPYSHGFCCCSPEICFCFILLIYFFWNGVYC